MTKHTTRIRVSDLQKVYSSRTGDVVALKGMDLEVYDNEFFCLLGPSGCGKSTLLRILADLEDHDGGEVDIRQNDEQNDTPLTNMVFQEYGIFPWKSVLENVAFGLKMRGVPKEEREATAQKYIDKVNLSGFEDSYPHQLSGGMKQRVGIARAFANDPEILLMDEPFGALDAQTQQLLQDELLSVWSESKKTAFYVTHDIEEAVMLGDRLGIMTARPGSLKETLAVDIDRPRSSEIQSSKRFNELRDQVWDVLKEEVQRAEEQER